MKYYIIFKNDKIVEGTAECTVQVFVENVVNPLIKTGEVETFQAWEEPEDGCRCDECGERVTDGWNGDPRELIVMLESDGTKHALMVCPDCMAQWQEDYNKSL